MCASPSVRQRNICEGRHLNVGVRRIQAHEAIHAFLRALPGIQETGILLSYGQLPPNGIVSIMGADSEGALAGNPLHTLIQDLERETQERGRPSDLQYHSVENED